MSALSATPPRRTWRARLGTRRLTFGLVALALGAAYPVWVLGTVYATVLDSGLPGGRHGPQDAYRHSLASALVAYTVSPRCVAWVTQIMEGGDPHDPFHAMDAHNNRFGARIGAEAGSLAEVHAGIRAAVDAGAQVDFAGARSALREDRPQLVWMPRRYWEKRLY